MSDDTLKDNAPVSSRFSPEVVCLGEAMAQFTSVDGHPLESARGFSVHAAGAESNVAHGLAQLGARVSWISRTGNDALGRMLVHEIADSHVDVSRVRVEETARTGIMVKDPNPNGSTVTYYRELSAATRIDTNDVDTALALGAEIIHFSGITPALSPSCRNAVEHGLRTAHLTATTTSFDINYRPNLWPSQEVARDVLTPLAELADVVFVGLDEARDLWGVETSEDVRHLLSHPNVIIVKDGSREATAFTATTAISVPALAVEVVEPVGAGDAFAAGWLHGLLRKLPQENRLRLGHLMAGHALRSITDQFILDCSPEELIQTAESDSWATIQPSIAGVV